MDVHIGDEFYSMLDPNNTVCGGITRFDVPHRRPRSGFSRGVSDLLHNLWHWGRVCSPLYLMSLVVKVREWLVVSLTRGWKSALRVITRKGEIERIILLREPGGERGGLSVIVVKRVAQSIARSSQLKEVKGAIFGGRPFSINDILDKIVRIKRLRDNDVISALRWILQVRVTRA